MIGVNPVFGFDYTTFYRLSKLNSIFVATFTFYCHDGMSGGVHCHVKQSAVAINAPNREVVFFHDESLCRAMPGLNYFVLALSLSRKMFESSCCNVFKADRNS